MEEYAKGLYRLARFATIVVPDEANRAWKFERKLRPNIKPTMSGFKRTTARKSLEAALKYEQDVEEAGGHSESRIRRRNDHRTTKRQQLFQRQSYPASVLQWDKK